MAYVDTIGRWGRGNIDLNNRIVVHNSDGTISTERSFSVEIDGQEVLLPSIINGIVETEEFAIAYYYERGEYLGMFDTVQEANAYANQLHERQQWYYTERPADKFFLEIDGFDIAPYIKQKGLKWSRNDIDSAKAGRNLAGTMNRGRVVTKVKLEISCSPLSQSVSHMILNLIYPEYVTVHYIDPMLGERTAQFYSNNVPVTFNSQSTDGELLWDDISFPLVER